jgi:hypothetical protein
VTSPTAYQDLSGLGGYYLEDSYVLAIHLSGDELAFDLEAVLLNDHPEYATPKPGEQHCYRLGRLSFGRPSEVRFAGAIALWLRPTVDMDGSVDLGNIDSLTRSENGIFAIAGDWGTIEVRSERPVLVIGSG